LFESRVLCAEVVSMTSRDGFLVTVCAETLFEQLKCMVPWQLVVMCCLS